MKSYSKGQYLKHTEGVGLGDQEHHYVYFLSLGGLGAPWGGIWDLGGIVWKPRIV